MQAVEILLNDARGVYIPRDFVEGFDVTKWNLDPDSWAVQTCLAGPDDNDNYWDAWAEILSLAQYERDGKYWDLHQDGDLFAYCLELMTDEEKQNFGFED